MTTVVLLLESGGLCLPLYKSALNTTLDPQLLIYLHHLSLVPDLIHVLESKELKSELSLYMGTLIDKVNTDETFIEKNKHKPKAGYIDQ